MPVELPAEIFGMIVGLLARPVLLYGYHPPDLYALHQLCLVSHFAHGAAAPFLYQSIAIRSLAGLTQLHRTRADENTFASFYPTTSLSVHLCRTHADVNTTGPFAASHPITISWSLPASTLLAGLITLSRKSLQRLSFHIRIAHAFSHQAYLAHNAVAGCPHLRELTTTISPAGADIFLNATVRWPYLHHLSLDGMISSSTLISIATTLPSLTHLLLLARASHETARTIIHGSRTLRRLIIIYESERVLVKEALLDRLVEYTHTWGSDAHVTQLRRGDLDQLWVEFGMFGQPLLPGWPSFDGLGLDGDAVVGMRWDVGGS